MLATLRECAADYPDYIYEIKIAGGPYIWAMAIIGPWGYCARFRFTDTDSVYLRELIEMGVESIRSRFNEVYHATYSPPRML